MLGLGSFANVMDTLVYRRNTPHHDHSHDLGLTIPLTSIVDLEASSFSPTDSDPILEDYRDVPLDRNDDVDYSSQPPEIGLQLTLDEHGSEVSLVGTLPRHEQIYMSSSYADEGGSDEYPFEAITYGESIDFLGLHYSDHTYISTRETPKRTGQSDQLCLLAKVALSKEDKSANVTARKAHGLIISSDTSAPTSTVLVSRQSSVPGTTYPLIVSSSTMRPVQTNVSRNITLNTTNQQSANTSGQAFVLPSSVQNGGSSSLQLHRVSSSLTPHIVLRTSIPALQISTTAPQLPLGEPTEDRQCVFGHALDVHLQCQHCDSTRLAPITVPNRPVQSSTQEWSSSNPHATTAASLIVQRPNISVNPAIRISRSSALGVAGPQSGRVFVSQTNLTPPSSHIQLRLSNNTTSSNETNPSYYFNLIQHSPQIFPSATHQTTRTSKRKQDLVTLITTDDNVGFDRVHDDTVTVNSEVPSEISPSMDVDIDIPCVNTTVCTAVVTDNRVKDTITTDMRSNLRKPNTITTSPPHQLLMNDDCPLSDELIADEEFECHPASLTSSTLSSYSIVHSPSLDESEFRMSDRFQKRIDYLKAMNMLKYGIAVSELPASPARCRAVSFDFNRKGLIAAVDLYPGDSIIEYHGSCMLLCEYTEMHDFRKHFNPYVLFYKDWENVPLCVDAREFGNESRFIRRSCTPNCEVRHIVSACPDSSVRFQLVLFATARILQSTELTIPFDFDHTACRYPVSCACSRKTCSLSREIYGKTGGGKTRGGKRPASLLYSRKALPGARFGPAAKHFLTDTSRKTYADSLLDEEDDDDMQNPDYNLVRNTDKITRRTIRGHRTLSRSSSVMPTRGRVGRPRGKSNKSSLLRNTRKPRGNARRGRPPTTSLRRMNSFNSRRVTVPERKNKKIVEVHPDPVDIVRSPSGSLDADAGPELDMSDSQLESPANLMSPESPINHCEKTDQSTVKRKSTRQKPVDHHRKNREDASAKVIRSPPTAELGKVNYQHDEEGKKKSREDIWMAEVLRRIERMEKKQGQQMKQHRKYSVSSDNMDFMYEPGSSSQADILIKTPSPTSATSDGYSGRENVFDLFDGSHTPSSTTPLGSPTSLKESKFTVTTSPSLTVSKNRSSRIKSPKIYGRRRSQAALLSDGLSVSTTDQQDSREDRWLKFQLRRIAQLEEETPNVSQSPDPTSPKTSHRMKKSQPSLVDPQISALKEVSYNESKLSLMEAGSETTSVSQDHATVSSEIFHFDDKKKSTENPLTTPGDTDCGMIVYRTTDDDPMAKFSRSRSIDRGTTYSSVQHFGHTPTMVTTSQENMPPGNIQTELDSRQSGVTSSTPRAAPTPCPTKKRWLSQALMEEAGDVLSSGLTATDDALRADRTADNQLTHPPATQLSSPTHTPVNPKKRIISQFSHSVDVELAEQEVWEHLPNRSSVTGDSECPNSPNPLSSPSVDDFHSTPLPPKKATVKKHAEEMRKVRVSLSEYRRRKNLSSATIASNKQPATNVPSDSMFNSLEDKYCVDLPSVIPHRLTDDISQLPLLDQTVTRDDRLVDLHNYIRSATNTLEMISLEEHNFFNGSTPFADDNPLDEGGPRTPSEPPDDEDFTSSVYLGSSSKPFEDVDAIAAAVADEDDELVDFHWSPPDRRSPPRAPESPSKGNCYSLGGIRSPVDNRLSPQMRRRYSSEEDITHQAPSPAFPTSEINTKRRHSTTDMLDSSSQLSMAADYLIRRDEQIRQWQKFHSSYDWEPKHSALKIFNSPLGCPLVTTTTTATNTVTDATLAAQQSPMRRQVLSATWERRSSKPSISIYNPSNRKSLRHQSQVLDVEQTLWRLHDRLRSQLDRAKHSLPPSHRGVTSAESRSSATTMADDFHADSSRYIDDRSLSNYPSGRTRHRPRGLTYPKSYGEIH